MEDLDMPARIYKPSRNAMQSGKGKSKWVLEFERHATPPTHDGLDLNRRHHQPK